MVETEQSQVKTKLLAQIMIFTLVVGVVANHDLEARTMAQLGQIVAKGQGLMLLPPGSLLDGTGSLVFNLEGETEKVDYTVVAPVELIDQHVTVTSSGEKRKARTMALLAEKGIPAVNSLPPIVGDENFVPRSKEEVAGRTLAILITSVYAEFLSSNKPDARLIAEDLLKQYDVLKYLSPAERAFWDNPNPDQTTVVNMTWRYECALVGLWALGLEHQLSYPDGICNVAAMGTMVRELGSWEAIMKASVLRAPSEILDEADLVYRYDWACVEARLKGREEPAGLNSGVVLERHRMFNWLIRYMDSEWDDISTDT